MKCGIKIFIETYRTLFSNFYCASINRITNNKEANQKISLKRKKGALFFQRFKKEKKKLIKIKKTMNKV